jgi:hypothetical protein
MEINKLQKGQVKLLDKLNDIEQKLDTLEQLIFKFWESDTTFGDVDTTSQMKLFDEEGNLLPNVTTTMQVETDDEG